MKAKSAAERETIMSVPDDTCCAEGCSCKQPMVVQSIKDAFKEHEEDKWERYEERLKYMEENGI